jgi:hypothetical protein
MTETKHKEGCWYPKALEEEKRYHERWPDACTRCGGWGGFPWYDHDTGLQDYDPCPQCLMEGKCPRCKGGVIAETYWDAGLVAICENCSFIEATTPGEPPLVEDPCECLGYYDDFDVWHPYDPIQCRLPPPPEMEAYDLPY